VTLLLLSYLANFPWKARCRSSISQRLYQLTRQSGAIADHTFAIEFRDPGVQAFAFTFG
jgi:hypothetical protein